MVPRDSSGREGVHHYGVFDGDRLVAVGSLFIGDGVGWLGFDETTPRADRGWTPRQAISAVRMETAAAAGLARSSTPRARSRRARGPSRDRHLLYEQRTTRRSA